jgi:hypothetical protein
MREPRAESRDARLEIEALLAFIYLNKYHQTLSVKKAAFFVFDFTELQFVSSSNNNLIFVA